MYVCMYVYTYIYSHPGVDRIWFLEGVSFVFFEKYRDF